MIDFEAARRIADTVLYEGYILYPYRASHGKNASGVRWQFGVLVPKAQAEASPLPPGSMQSSGTVSGAVETWCQQTECILEAGDDATVDIRLRFLHLQARIVEQQAEDGSFRPVDSLTAGGELHVTWDEGVETEFDARVPLAELFGGEQAVAVELPASEESEAIEGGRVVRRRRALSLRLVLSAEELPGPYGIAKLRVRTENATDWSDGDADRGEVVLRSPVATHLILAADPGSRFVSLLDPPQWAKPAVQSCENQSTWPVLVGEEGTTGMMLSSPMVLPDHPRIAPESPMDLFDGTENDELLSLRIMTLTDDEKAEARATDPRAAAIIEHADNLPPEIYERLHGAIRSLRQVTGEDFPEIWTDDSGDVKAPPSIFDPTVDATYSPETDTVDIGGLRVGKGTRVVLRPAKGRSDAQDMFLAGRIASVQAILFDADDDAHLAVTLDDDPGADLQASHGRYRYFKIDEVEPLSDLEEAQP
ncbi:MAG TPA: hypothetical protein VFS16_16985 [Acidimicrobiia bacterium]|nr:hypothetical protein [Acidimicrobiia bacterium]